MLEITTKDENKSLGRLAYEVLIMIVGGFLTLYLAAVGLLVTLKLISMTVEKLNL